MVRLEIGHLCVLIQRIGLEVKARRVGVGGSNVRAGRQRQRADDGQHDSLAPVVEVDLVAGLQLHAAFVLDKAALLGELHGRKYAFALGLGRVEECLVIFTVGVHLGLFGGCEPIKAVLRPVEQLLLFFFCHDAFSFMISSSNSSARRENSSREAQSFVMAYWQRAS